VEASTLSNYTLVTIHYIPKIARLIDL
jgi:hypothetical protein